VTDALASRLGTRALELIDIPSVSRDEERLAAHVLAVLRTAGVNVRDAGDTCVIAGVERRGQRPFVLLAGHLDTVPAQDNVPGAQDADAIHGLGAADMKGAVAVMVELAIEQAHRQGDGAIDLGFVFFGREELPHSESALTPLLAREPGLCAADLAIVMEPTGGELQLGCLGNIFAQWTFHGRSGHAARPWLADNAIDRAAAGLSAVAAHAPLPVELAGLTYHEVVTATGIESGVARNVIPDLAIAQLNHRYPPGMAPQEAETRLHALCDPHGTLEVLSNAPSGPVPIGNALVERLQRTGALTVAAKQAWTPVAEFGAAGVDAVNFGPGEPAQAHARKEQVTRSALVHAFSTLRAFTEDAG
jgi:succinyl-diaminopimelate desuccinylase